jgi:hypothetical protein
LQRLGVSKTRTTPLYPQSDGMVERYIKTIEEQPRTVVASHQRDWDEGLPLFLLAYRASTNDTTGFTPASLVFGRELRLPCELLFEATPDKERPTTDYAADLLDNLHDIHNYARQTSEANQRPDEHSIRKTSQLRRLPRGRQSVALSPNPHEAEIAKFQSSWEGPFKVVTRLNDMVYRIQKNSRSRMILVYLVRLATYHGAARDERN